MIEHPIEGLMNTVMSNLRDMIDVNTVIGETIELENPRVLEKFSIEYQYWKERDVDWKIVTEKEINRDLARNLQWLHSGPKPGEIIPNESIRENAGTLLLALINEDLFAFSVILEIVEESFGLRIGSAMALFKEFVLKKIVLLDINRPINFGDPFAKEE